MRRTEVRPTSSRRAISALATPARWSLRISAACATAVAGRPRRLPFCRAWASPARVRSPRISRSNAANTASNPAIARPAGVVRSSASVSDTKPTPRCSSSWSVASRSVTDRPQPVQPPYQHDIDLAATCGLQKFLPRLSLHRAGANFTDLHGDRPAPPSGILPPSATLHWAASADRSWKRGRRGPLGTFSPTSVPGQKHCRILPLERPVWRPFQSGT